MRSEFAVLANDTDNPSVHACQKPLSDIVMAFSMFRKGLKRRLKHVFVMSLILSILLIAYMDVFYVTSFRRKGALITNQGFLDPSISLTNLTTVIKLNSITQNHTSNSSTLHHYVNSYTQNHNANSSMKNRNVNRSIENHNTKRSREAINANVTTKNHAVTSWPKNQNLKTYLRDIDESLCPRKQVLMNASASNINNCPENGIVTVTPGGRLGNQMFEYAAVWAVARKTGLQPYVPQCIRDELDQYFENLSFPSLSYVSHCLVNWENKVKDHKLWRHKDQSILLKVYVEISDVVLMWAENIRQEFKFKRRFIEGSSETFKAVAQSMNDSAPIYIGVHVRRTDYVRHLKILYKRPLINATFFINAMDYFRAKYDGNLAFLVVSDDLEWCRKNLVGQRKDVFVVGQNGSYGPGQDMALMAACNHSIIDYGTFGAWGAILANGETIIFNITNHVTRDVAKMLPDWHVLPSNLTGPNLT